MPQSFGAMHRLTAGCRTYLWHGFQGSCATLEYGLARVSLRTNSLPTYQSTLYNSNNTVLTIDGNRQRLTFLPHPPPAPRQACAFPRVPEHPRPPFGECSMWRWGYINCFLLLTPRVFTCYVSVQKRLLMSVNGDASFPVGGVSVNINGGGNAGAWGRQEEGWVAQTRGLTLDSALADEDEHMNLDIDETLPPSQPIFTSTSA
ncbi:hypothetical protein EW146_g9662, partial [Bondarzewia mesenterica]